MGLLAGTNDMKLAGSNQGRSGKSIVTTTVGTKCRQSLARPVVQNLLKLIRFRNEHPAFQGAFSLLPCDDPLLVIRWDNGETWAQLKVDFANSTMDIEYLDNGDAQCLDLHPGNI